MVETKKLAGRWALADRLKEEIDRARQDPGTDGLFAPGKKLPQTPDLAGRYEVSQHMMMEALVRLQQSGHLELAKGDGLYVSDFEPVRQTETTRMRAGVWASGQAITDSDSRPVSIDDITRRRATPPPQVAKLMGMAPGEIAVVRSRRQLTDGKPVTISSTYIPLDLAEGTLIDQDDTGPGGVPARLAELGHAPVRYHADFEAMIAYGPESTALKVPHGTALLAQWRAGYDSDERVVEFTLKMAPAGRAVFAVDWEA